jgi:hypothetical protein
LGARLEKRKGGAKDVAGVEAGGVAGLEEQPARCM